MATPKLITGGILAAAISPRRSREHSIDLAAALELIDFLYEGGVEGITLLGSTGEFVHFMLEDRARMLDFAVKRSRVPIMVNVSHSTLDGAVFLGQEAAGSGVAAVLLMPPYYFRYDQDAVRTFCLQAGEELAKEVPVYLYHIPRFTNSIDLDTATSLLATGIFAGIKDSSGDTSYMDGLLANRASGNIKVFCGDDKRFAKARAAGADGAISGVACAMPELMVRLDKAVTSGEQDVVERLDAKVDELVTRVRQFPTPMAIKEAVKQRGVDPGAQAVPLSVAGCKGLEEFSSWFKEWFPGVLRECR